MRPQLHRVIICRSAPTRESLLPGARLGYNCVICQEPLQLTPHGYERLKSNPGTDLLCNECGLLYVQMAERSGHEIESHQGPVAQAQLDQGNDSPLANWVRRRAQ